MGWGVGIDFFATLTAAWCQRWPTEGVADSCQFRGGWTADRRKDVTCGDFQW